MLVIPVRRKSMKFNFLLPTKYHNVFGYATDYRELRMGNFYEIFRIF